MTTPKQRAALPLVRYARPKCAKGGGGWAWGRLLEVTAGGVHVILDHKGSKHRITASDVERDHEADTAVPTQLAQRRTKRMGA